MAQQQPPQMQQQMPGQDPTAAFRESCASQMVVSGAVSGLAGIVLGAVLAPFNSSMQAQIEHLPLRQQFVRGGQEIAAQSKSWGKNLAVIGAVFSTTECFVEKARGRTDKWNQIGGGCLTGAILAYGSGPQAMCLGCAGFAAFSAAIDAMGFGPHGDH